MSFCATCIPSYVVTIRRKDPPWFHNEIMSSLRQRLQAYKAKRSHSSFFSGINTNPCEIKLTLLTEQQH